MPAGMCGNHGSYDDIEKENSMHGGDRYRNEVNIDFSINVNPSGIAPKIQQAMQEALLLADVYPDEQCEALREVIAKQYAWESATILCGNGASELLLGFVRAYAPKRAVVVAPGFSGYLHALHSISCEICYFYAKEEQAFSLDDALLSFLEEQQPELVILTNPNNPNGALLSHKYLKKISNCCANIGARLLVDECFIALTKEGDEASFLQESKQWNHVFILQALTKSMAIPGVRLGYLFCPAAKDAARIKKQLSEWNVSVIAQKAGIAAMQLLEDKTYLEKTRALLERESLFLRDGLQKMGCKVYPSHANYLLFYEKTIPWQKRLLQQQILIRDCSDYEGLTTGFYRIAIRTHAENEALLLAMQKCQIEERNERD